MMTADLKPIRVFAAVAELNSFSKAAEKLFMTRSAVSKIISKLEAELGVSLLIRLPRDVKLTDEGVAFLEYSLVTLKGFETMRERIDSSKAKVTGSLTVSLPVIFGRKYLLPALKTLLAAQPDLRLNIVFDDRFVDLHSDEYDLVVRTGEMQPDNTLCRLQIGSHSMQVCASPEYLKTAPPIADLDAIQHHALIAYSRRGYTQHWKFINDSGERIAIAPTGRLMMNAGEEILACTLDGFGLAWLPSWLARPYLTSGRLISLLDDYAIPQYPINILWKNTGFIPMKLRMAIETLRTACAAHSGERSEQS